MCIISIPALAVFSDELKLTVNHSTSTNRNDHLTKMRPGGVKLAPALASTAFQFGPHDLSWLEAFYLSNRSVAIVNQSPIKPGHCLVLSRRVAPRLVDLSPEEAGDLWRTVHTVAPALQRHFGATALTVAVQDGVEAGQTVPHVHVHIVPRVAEDFKRNDDVYDALDEDNRERRTLAQMAQEAAELRPLFDQLSLPIPKDCQGQ